MVFLVIDDVMIMRRLTGNILRDAGYHNILEAMSGEEAIKILNSEHVDFVITDWLLPHISGLQIVNYIRGSKDLKDLPIIMVTSVDEKNEVIKAINAKVDGYIRKPFSANTLIAQIKTVLKAKKIEDDVIKKAEIKI